MTSLSQKIVSRNLFPFSVWPLDIARKEKTGYMGAACSKRGVAQDRGAQDPGALRTRGVQN